MKRLILLMGAIGLVFATAGCGAAILAYQDAVGFDRPASSVFALGSTRQEVEARIGKPESSRALPDGSQLDSYAYTIRNPEWRKMKWMFAVGTVITIGFVEAVWVPWAAYEVWRARHTATFTYGPDDRVLDHGPPPRYGPPDDRLEPLSFAEVRERCRSENPDAYHECVVRRIAIWAIE